MTDLVRLAVQADYDHAIAWAKKHARKEDRDDLRLCFLVAFLNNLAGYRLNHPKPLTDHDYLETMTILTEEAHP